MGGHHYLRENNTEVVVGKEFVKEKVRIEYSS